MAFSDVESEPIMAAADRVAENRSAVPAPADNNRLRRFRVAF